MERVLSTILEEIVTSLPSLKYELGLTVLFLLVVVGDLVKKVSSHQLLQWLTAIGLILLLPFIAVSENIKGLVGIESQSVFLKYFFSLLAIVVIGFDRVFGNKKRQGEYYSILLAMLLGLSFLIMSSNFVVMYLGMETVSICSYILTVFKLDKRSSEGGIKYILFGAISSAVMLYGISLLYGISHHLDFESVFTNSAIQTNILGQIGVIFTLGGLLFKLAAVPFHIWVPDVYESAPTPIVTFFSIAPKAAVVYLLSNWLEYFTENNAFFISVLAIVAILSIMIGNLSALRQQSLKRMLGYSSIAHAGFLLIAVISSTKETLFFYLVIYLFMNTIAFALANWQESISRQDKISLYRGLGLKYPFIGVVTLITMISLAGLPLTAGFNAKLLVFADLWGNYSHSTNYLLILLLVIGLINVVISLYYYLRLPYVMFFRQGENINIQISLMQKIFFSVFTIPLLVFFFKPDWLFLLISWLS